MSVRPLLVFGVEYPLEMGGGVSVLVRQLLQGLHSKFRLALVSPDASETVARTEYGHLLERHLSWSVQSYSTALSRELSEHLSGWGASLAHFHVGGNFGWGNRRPGTSPIPMLNRQRIPCVTTVHLVVSPLHGVCAPTSPRWFKAAALCVSWLGKMHALKHTTAEVAVSEHDCKHLQRWYWPLRERFLPIYHSRLSAGAPEINVMPEQREKVLLHVGHRAFRKGQPVLVEAFSRLAARHPEWKLVLVGPSPEPACEEQINQLIERAGLENRVEVLGDRDDVAERMKRAAVYVQPSLQEALGLALQEALFHGCACVGTRAGGIPELIVHEENGLLVPPGEVKPLATVLDRLLSDEALRTRLSLAGPESIREKGMTAESMIEKHIALYEQILREQR